MKSGRRRTVFCDACKICPSIKMTDCKECRRIVQRLDYKRNPEQHRKYAREFRLKYKEKLYSATREYRGKNIEKVRTWSAAHYSRHRAKLVAAAKARHLKLGGDPAYVARRLINGNNWKRSNKARARAQARRGHYRIKWGHHFVETLELMHQLRRRIKEHEERA